jgi:hypothetical protein
MIRPRPAAFSLAVLATLLSAAPSAMAAFTAISDAADQYDEPNLIGVNPYPDNLNPSVLETLYGEANLERIDDRFDVAFRHTGAEATVATVAHFTALGSSLWRPNDTPFGAAIAGVGPGVYGYFTDPYPGSIALSDSGPVFGLKLNTRDRFGYSDPSLNLSGVDQLVTFEIVGNAGHPNNAIGSYVLAWEDSLLDNDYQDAVFEISGVVPVPEPGMAALAASGALMAARCGRR